VLFEAIVAAVKGQGGFDADDVTVGSWVNEVYAAVVVAAEWQMATVTLASTVAAQAGYDLPDSVASVEGLYLDSGDGPAHYIRVGAQELWELRAGRRQLVGSGGAFGPAWTAGGVEQIELFPAPETSGVEITALVSQIPSELIAGQSPGIPADLHPGLIEGAIALGLARVDERLDSAQVFDAKVAQMADALKRRKNKRVGSTPHRLGLWGSDWR
jgi:hypothetical protein